MRIGRDEPCSFGWRGGARVGVGLADTSGAYLGLRGGPTFSFGYQPDEWLPTLTLEGLVAIGVGADVAGAGVFGAALGLGWDYYGTFNIAHGRPLRGECGETWRARARARDGAPGVPGAIAKMPAELRESIGSRWALEGLDEYASIASFAQLALELAALGAPETLVARAVGAAFEEVRHARACFAFAERYLGRRIVPETLPAVGVRRSVSFERLAIECWQDGCLGEGASAEVAFLRAGRANDPAVRSVLEGVARDEARHAELGWDVLRYCLARTPSDVRDALREARREPRDAEVAPENELPELSDHGLASPAFFERVRERVAQRSLTRFAELVA